MTARAEGGECGLSAESEMRGTERERCRMGLERSVFALLVCVGSMWLLGCGASQGLSKWSLTSGQGHINLGQRWGSVSPLMYTKANLSDLTSAKSSFEFRTLDPEGVVFYGDTHGGTDWFVLALRGGVPEMQIKKADIRSSVAGGPKLNDGQWHQVGLRSAGRSVILEVDHKVVLVVGLDSPLAMAQLETKGQIRLSLGGILIKEEELFQPLGLEMDGCIRKGNWLNLTSQWETSLDSKPQSCFPHISKGSYFPGLGLVVFNTSDFPVETRDGREVVVEITGDLLVWTGTILSIQTHDGESLVTVTVQNQTKELTVIRGAHRVFVGSLLPAENRLALFFSQDTVKIQLDLTGHGLTITEDGAYWLTQWNQGMFLSLGGVQEGPIPGGFQYLHGCVGSIRIQGRDVDLDRALYKHCSISSHSCPA